MKEWNRPLKAGGITLVLLLLGLEIYMEIRLPCDEIFLKSEDAAAILRRIPEAEITEKNRKLGSVSVPRRTGFVESGRGRISSRSGK